MTNKEFEDRMETSNVPWQTPYYDVDLWDVDGDVCLDGHFTLAQLKTLVEYLEERPVRNL